MFQYFLDWATNEPGKNPESGSLIALVTEAGEPPSRCKNTPTFYEFDAFYYFYSMPTL